MTVHIALLLTLTAFPGLHDAEGMNKGDQERDRYVVEARMAVRQLARDLDHLQETIVADLAGKEQDLYCQVEAIIAALDSLQGALKKGASRDDLYKRFDEVDPAIHKLIEAARELGKDQRALQRALNYVQASDDQLHYDLSRGDVSPKRVREVTKRQARALAGAARELQQVGSYALAETPGRQVLLDNLGKLAKETDKFEKGFVRDPDRATAQKALEPVSQAWEKVIAGLKKLPPRENIYLLRGAVRVDQLHDRLYRLLGIEGKRPQLVIPT